MRFIHRLSTLFLLSASATATMTANPRESLIPLPRTTVSDTEHTDMVKVRGVVYDRKTHETLPGVSLVVSDNPKMGAVTNADGEFQLDAPTGSRLKVSYVGYETKMIDVTATAIKTELDEDNFKIDEVVVTGQGAEVQKRRLSSAYTYSTPVIYVDGVRVADLGIRLPLCETEAANQTSPSLYTTAQIPPFIPLNQDMDAFEMDKEKKTVVIKYNMNKVIVENKNSQYVAPFFK